MQPRLIKTTYANYTAQEWTGKNESGIIPIGTRILVLADKVAAKTTGGIELTGETQEKQNLAAETGLLVAVGVEAFRWISDRTRKWEGDKPVVGQRLIFERYAGQLHVGLDGQFYRLMEDGAVGGMMILPEDEANTTVLDVGSGEAADTA